MESQVFIAADLWTASSGPPEQAGDKVTALLLGSASPRGKFMHVHLHWGASHLHILSVKLPSVVMV